MYPLSTLLSGQSCVACLLSVSVLDSLSQSAAAAAAAAQKSYYSGQNLMALTHHSAVTRNDCEELEPNLQC